MTATFNPHGGNHMPDEPTKLTPYPRAEDNPYAKAQVSLPGYEPSVFPLSEMPYSLDMHEARRAETVDGPPVPVVERLYERLLGALRTKPDSFDMVSWHSFENQRDAEYNGQSDHQFQIDPINECGTTHCHAGYVVHLAGQTGYDLEAALGVARTDDAALLIIAKSCPWVEEPPSFTADDAEGMRQIKELAAQEVLFNAGWSAEEVRMIEYGNNLVHEEEEEEE
jgi:hypothetical protein